jgi:hypothetical protein
MVDFFLQAEALNRADQTLLRILVVAGVIDTAIEEMLFPELDPRRAVEIKHREDCHRAVRLLATQRMIPPIKDHQRSACLRPPTVREKDPSHCAMEPARFIGDARIDCIDRIDIGDGQIVERTTVRVHFVPLHVAKGETDAIQITTAKLQFEDQSAPGVSTLGAFSCPKR